MPPGRYFFYSLVRGINVSMIKSWKNIEKHYSELSESNDKFVGMRNLVKEIRGSELESGLYAWTSMHDLCITQTEVSYPNYEPYLKITPLFNGSVEFRYIDTHNSDKQWSRTVVESESFNRLLAFVNQLHWFIKYANTSNP